MERKRAIEILRKEYDPRGCDETLRKALETLIPELAESEDEAVKNGVTVEQARKIITLQDFTVEELCDELRDRGYFGQVTKRITIEK